MRTKKFTRYYCDFCSRGSLTAESMRRHESICFSNPKRGCYLCENAMPDTGSFVKAFVAKHQIEQDVVGATDLTEEQVAEIRDAVGNCPACTLAVIKQSKAFAFDHFDFKAEKADWMKEISRERWE